MDLQVADGGAVDGQQNQQQPANSAWSVIKGLLFRMFVIYMISSFFRGKPQAPTAPDGKPGVPAAASSNLFPNGTVMVRIAPYDMWLSEHATHDSFFYDISSGSVCLYLRK